MVSRRFHQVLGSLRRVLRPDVEAAGSDRQLLHQFVAARDQTAFAELVRRHGPMVLSVCRRTLNDAADADDAFQATFLLLARKADAVGWRESIGGWLHEAAFRVARRARAVAQRRRSVERKVAPMEPEEPELSEAERRELRAVLDEELACLPEKYRAPLVLCYLEGRTNDQAAEQLGWTKGTVSGRLARARDLLRRRLARRSLAFSTAGLSAALAGSTVPAAVSAELLEATLQLVGLPGLATASLPAVVLVQGVMMELAWSRVKLIAVVLFVLGLSGGLGVGTMFWTAGGVASATPTAIPEKDPMPRVSEPFEKNGLAVTLAPTRAVFGTIEPLRFTFSAKNVSDGPLPVYNLPVGVRLGEFRFTPVHGPEWSARWAWEVKPDRLGYEARHLAAGQTTTLTVELGGYCIRPVEGAAEAPPRLLPGRYRVRALFQLEKPKPTGPGEDVARFWAGEVRTRETEITIAEGADAERWAISKATRVNEVDFETIVAKSWPSKADSGSDPGPALRITNRSKGELKFENLVRLRVFTAAGTELEATGGNTFRSAMPATVTAPPQGSILMSVGGLRFRERQPGDAGLNLSWEEATGAMWLFHGLEAGAKYRMSLGCHTAAEKRAAYWVGDAESGAVEVEIPK